LLCPELCTCERFSVAQLLPPLRLEGIPSAGIARMQFTNGKAKRARRTYRERHEIQRLARSGGCRLGGGNQCGPSGNRSSGEDAGPVPRNRARDNHCELSPTLGGGVHLDRRRRSSGHRRKATEPAKARGLEGPATSVSSGIFSCTETCERDAVYSWLASG